MISMGTLFLWVLLLWDGFEFQYRELPQYWLGNVVFDV